MSAAAETAKRQLRQLVSRSENFLCADCKLQNPTWASKNLGVFICMECAGVHRALGVHISQVRSIDLDTWDAASVQVMQQWGNVKANAYWECRLPPENSINPSVPTVRRRDFIFEKYARKQYYGSPSQAQLSAVAAAAHAAATAVPVNPVEQRRLARLAALKLAASAPAPVSPPAPTTPPPSSSPTSPSAAASPFFLIEPSVTSTTTTSVSVGAGASSGVDLFSGMSFGEATVTAPSTPPRSTTTPTPFSTPASPSHAHRGGPPAGLPPPASSPTAASAPLTPMEARRLARLAAASTGTAVGARAASASPWVTASDLPPPAPLPAVPPPVMIPTRAPPAVGPPAPRGPPPAAPPPPPPPPTSSPLSPADPFGLLDSPGDSGILSGGDTSDGDMFAGMLLSAGGGGAALSGGAASPTIPISSPGFLSMGSSSPGSLDLEGLSIAGSLTLTPQPSRELGLGGGSSSLMMGSDDFGLGLVGSASPPNPYQLGASPPLMTPQPSLQDSASSVLTAGGSFSFMDEASTTSGVGHWVAEPPSSDHRRVVNPVITTGTTTTTTTTAAALPLSPTFDVRSTTSTTSKRPALSEDPFAHITEEAKSGGGDVALDAFAQSGAGRRRGSSVTKGCAVSGCTSARVSRGYCGKHANGGGGGGGVAPLSPPPAASVHSASLAVSSTTTGFISPRDPYAQSLDSFASLTPAVSASSSSSFSSFTSTRPSTIPAASSSSSFDFLGSTASSSSRDTGGADLFSLDVTLGLASPSLPPSSLPPPPPVVPVPAGGGGGSAFDFF